MQPKERSLAKSEELWRRAQSVIPAGTQTLSKAPNQFVNGVAPKYIARGSGSHVWDADGNEYIDYPMGLGAILLGHAYPRVVEAVSRQIRDGTVYTLMHPLEVEVAETIRACVPCAEMVRFGKNGSDATTAAIRVAKAATGRKAFAYCGYHGWQDWFAVTTPRDKGLPLVLRDHAFPFTYNDIESLRRIFDAHPGEISAVIMEQGVTEPKDGFLQRVIDLAHERGALYILDEIVTGFRYALGGAQERYGIMPDLAAIGKGMANGFPISAVVGKREFMKQLEDVFFSMTFGGDTSALAAAQATISELREKPVIEHIHARGAQLQEGFRDLARKHSAPAEILGAPSRMAFLFPGDDGEPSLDLRSVFLQETVKRGVLFGGPVFPTFSHTEEDIARTLEACDDALAIVARAAASREPRRFLEGEPVGVVFRPQPVAR